MPAPFRRLLFLWWRLTRGMTLGVRGIVLNAEGAVFLVRHTYMPGWHLPGGGVDAGESFIEAMHRELREEGNIEIIETPVLHGICLNKHISKRDHVAVYIIRVFQQSAAHVPDREIAEVGFFAPSALPETTTQGTRRRIEEVLNGQACAAFW